jgi:hypothetical protein
MTAASKFAGLAAHVRCVSRYLLSEIGADNHLKKTSFLCKKIAKSFVKLSRFAGVSAAEPAGEIPSLARDLIHISKRRHSRRYFFAGGLRAGTLAHLRFTAKPELIFPVQSPCLERLVITNMNETVLADIIGQ